MTAPLTAPILLSPHFVERFYRASGRMSAFRGQDGGAYDSEEWIGSTTTVFGGAPDEGLSVLDDGTTLRAAIEEDPVAALGPAHVARFGSSTELLLKILDAGQRLPVHVHPDRAFAHEHLGSWHGKAEAWVVLEAPEGAGVFVGFNRPVDRGEVRALMDSQDSRAMLEAMHELPVGAGDTVFVPAGLPHAIGEGILLAELQEPSDFSMMIEWEGYALDAAATGRLGLDVPQAIGCVNGSALPRDAAERLRGRIATGPDANGRSALSPLADQYFRAESVADGGVLSAAYSIVLVTSGSLSMAAEGRAPRAFHAGQTVLLPYAAGEVRVSGDGLGVRFRPPAPEASILYAGR